MKLLGALALAAMLAMFLPAQPGNSPVGMALAQPIVVAQPEHMLIVLSAKHPDHVAVRCGEAARATGCITWLGPWCQMHVPIATATVPLAGIPLWGDIVAGDRMAIEWQLRQQCEAGRIERGLLPPL